MSGSVVSIALGLLAALVVVVAARGGWRRGAVGVVARLAGLLLGFGGGLLLGRTLPLDRFGPVARLGLAAALALGGALLGSALGIALARRAVRAVPAGVRPLDRLAGAVLRGGLAAVVVGAVLGVGPARTAADAATAALRRTAPDQLAALVPARATALPDAAAVARVRDEVSASIFPVEASGCDGRSVQGTGFVVAGSLVVTNAHVVRGQSSFTVDTPDGTRAAVPVVYDAPADLAVLRVSDLSAAALPLAGSDAENGTGAVVVGYPRGHFAAVGAEVLQRLPVVDPGMTSGLALHESYRIDAVIDHGNSGSPLLDLDGRVIGVVNALIGGGGFAVSLAELTDVLADVATHAVGVGSCSQA